MKQNIAEQVTQRSHRRAFFGKLLASIGGGLIGGSLLKSIFNSGPQEHRAEQPINVKAHPLAVPRTKEGSSSNV